VLKEVTLQNRQKGTTTFKRSDIIKLAEPSSKNRTCLCEYKYQATKKFGKIFENFSKELFFSARIYLFDRKVLGRNGVGFRGTSPITHEGLVFVSQDPTGGVL